jgi:Nucleotidyl transferase AbiEii toxin, Type IV TA system
MAVLRHRRADLQALVGATAATLGIDQVFVEKDFWVIEVLRAATAPVGLESMDGRRHSVSTIFKGGTSLSRAYGLIERFSEDVDLLVGFPPVDAGVGAKDKVLKQIRDAVTQHLQLDPADVIHVATTKGVKRYVRYMYPGFDYSRDGAVTHGVLLEMGCRGGTYPVRQHELRSMIAEHAIEVLGESPEAWDEFAPVPVDVLAPERTLLEKLSLLHDCAMHSPDDEALQRLLRGGRHLYDVHRLLSNEDVLAALSALGPDGIGTLCADIDQHSRDAGFSYTPRPPGGYGDSPLLDPSSRCRSVLSSGYTAAMAMVYGHQPTLDDCLDAIRKRSALL